MLTTPCMESESGLIEIKDFDTPTIKALVNFLYTGRATDDLTKITNCYTAELLAAADVFGVLDLKEIVAQHLIKSMTVGNAVPSLTCAYHHNAGKLRKEAVAFIFNNMDEIKEIPEWKALHANHPVVSTDLLEVAFSKNNLKDSK